MSPSPPVPPPYASSASLNTTSGDDAGLTQSLSQLSLENQSEPEFKSLNLLPGHPTALKQTPRRSSLSPAPRLANRSPSDDRGPRNQSPPLLRKASTNSLRSANGGNHASSRRASSAQVTTWAPRRPSLGATSVDQEKSPMTESSLARDQLEAELDIHHGPNPTLMPAAIVVLNDAVYGHRFSRPRTSRGVLGTIVERPERIKAIVLGLAAAYVRLGERHSAGSCPLHPRRDILGLPSIPFRIRKTTRRLPLISPAVTNVHGMKWMEEFKMMCDSAEVKLAMGGKELQRPDVKRGADEPVPEKLHEGDLYLCSESLDAVEGALGAVCEAVDTVFGDGPNRAFVGIRPPGHHCSASHPSGFCWINNVQVGIMHAALTHGLTHAAIIDFDLHHGDGSQDITWKHNYRATTAPKNASGWKKAYVGYFSLHDINSYPCEMGDFEKVKNASLCIDNAHGQSIWNVHLQSWKTEQEFWQLYESKYSVLMDKARSYLKSQAERLRAANLPPKAAIFLSAGFDASEWESAGMQRHQVNVPTEFYARISHDIVQIAEEHGLFVEGRVISLLEGGYSDRALCSGVFSHLSGLVGGQSTVTIKKEAGGLGYEMGQKLGTVLQNDSGSLDQKLPSSHAYNPSWWASSELDLLENAAMKELKVSNKHRKSGPPTYSSPTQSSTAKLSEPIRIRRSLSGMSKDGTKTSTRPPSPPPPEVSWVTAAYELCKLIIPEHRQTESCTAEDLNAEASRIRRERQASLLGLPTAPSAPSSPERPTSRMALRERKAKQADFFADVADKVFWPSRLNHNPVLILGQVTGTPRGNASKPGRRSSRRLSGVSGAGTPRSETPPPIPPLPTGINSVDRPTTQRNQRPDNSMSFRTQSTDKLPIKKIRAPAPPRKPTTPKTTPRATPKATPRGGRRVTSPSRKSNSSATASASGPERASDHGAAPSASGPTSETAAIGVDNITTGMKRIKINLITQAHKNAREKANVANENSSLPIEIEQDQPKCVPGSRRSTRDVSPDFFGYADASMTEICARDNVSTPVATPVRQQPATCGQVFDGRQTESPTPRPDKSQPVTPDLYEGVELENDAAGGFIQYQPEGPDPEAISGQKPLTWLPPNVPTPSALNSAATPSPVKQSGLFHYSSGIPFAPRPQNSTGRPEYSSDKVQDMADENDELRQQPTVPVLSNHESLQN